MRTIIRKTAAGAIVVALLAASNATAAPEGFLPLPQKSETIPIQGQTATIVYQPSVRFSEAGGIPRADIHVEAGFGDLQRAIPAALTGWKANDECGDKVHVRNVALAPEGEAAALTGDVRYERWGCVKTKVPEFKGLKVTMELRTLAKTKLFQQTATVCLRLRPEIAEGGEALRLAAEVTCARPSSGSILGALSHILNLEDEFRRLADGELQDALAREKLSLALPADLAAFDPVMEEARFTTRPDGALGFEAEGRLSVPDEAARTALRQLITDYLRR